MALGVPELRQGSFFPPILKRRRLIDRALFAVVMEAYVHGVSTRRLDDLVAALGAASGISSKRGVPDLRRAPRGDGRLPLRAPGSPGVPWLFVDATHLKGRVGGQVVSRAVVEGSGVTANGDREVLGCAVGDACCEDSWTEFLRSLSPGASRGVRLVTSEHHRGIGAAVARCFVGAGWQRRRGQPARRLGQGPPRRRATRSQPPSAPSSPSPRPPPSPGLDRIVATLEPGVPEGARHARRRPGGPGGGQRLLRAPAPRSGPPTPSSVSTARSSAAATSSGSSPTTPPSNALVTAVVACRHDEWATAVRRYLSETSMARLRQTAPALPATPRGRRSLAS